MPTNLRSLFRRKQPPLPAPPASPQSPTDKPPRRRHFRRWILILGTVTVLGLARNQWPELMARIQDLDFPARFAVDFNARERLAGMLEALRPDPRTLGEEQQKAGDATPMIRKAVTDAEVLMQGGEMPPETAGAAASTPRAAPTPTLMPTPVPWRIGTRVYATAATEYTFLWMEPGADTPHLIAERYESGTSFDILEPGRAHAGYPVEIGGVVWWRLQAEDGLVGWAKDAQLTTAPLVKG